MFFVKIIFFLDKIEIINVIAFFDLEQSLIVFIVVTNLLKALYCEDCK